jgi:small subunit ribosomal protein S5
VDWSFNMVNQQAVSIDPQNRGRGRQGGGNNRDRNNQNAPREEKIFNEYVVSIDRVARVVKGGRRFRFKALVAIGDGKQRVGVGVSKGLDVQSAVAKATEKAKKSLITIPVVNATIPHEVDAKISGAKVLLMPASPGTGIIAGGAVRSIMSLTGVTNLLGKVLGSNNKVNNAYATIEALRKLVPREQWVNKSSVKKSTPKPKAEAKAKDEEAK